MIIQLLHNKIVKCKLFPSIFSHIPQKPLVCVWFINLCLQLLWAGYESLYQFDIVPLPVMFNIILTIHGTHIFLFILNLQVLVKCCYICSSLLYCFCFTCSKMQKFIRHSGELDLFHFVYEGWNRKRILSVDAEGCCMLVIVICVDVCFAMHEAVI